MSNSSRVIAKIVLVSSVLALAGFAGAQYGLGYVGPLAAPGGSPIFADEGSSLSGVPPVAAGSYVRYGGNYFDLPNYPGWKVSGIQGFSCDIVVYNVTDPSTGFVQATFAKFNGTGWSFAGNLQANSSFGGSGGDPIATLDYINGSGVYQGALYSTVDGSITNVNTNSLGVFAGPISNDFVSSFHGFFSDGGGNYHYQDELHFGLTDLNPTSISLASGFTSAELSSIDGSNAAGSVGVVAPDFSFMGQEPALWGLDLAGHKIGSAVMLPNNGTSGAALGVNAGGYVVGVLNGKAILWKKDGNGIYQAIDLNTLIPANSGWVLDSA
ncbi:MAG TPA: hypothetical protein VKT78_00285, partial [Fimbriimonadaceae bacterium]|nr:hypothetical protein [Fimbriimonadaceae bacterium]